MSQKEIFCNLWPPLTIYIMKGKREPAMTFSDLMFIFRFLPLFLLIYYLTPRDYRNWTLLAGSIIFYYIGVEEHPWMLGLLLGIALFTWGVGLLISALVRGKKFCWG